MGEKRKTLHLSLWLGISRNRAREITQEKASELLPKYSFGMGFYELSFTKHNGQEVLEFNELSANDLY